MVERYYSYDNLLNRCLRVISDIVIEITDAQGVVVETCPLPSCAEIRQDMEVINDLIN